MKTLNPVSLLRSATGLTQKDLARKAMTSQPTIALYESGSKSPTIATLQRLASSLGLELSVNYVRPLTREDQRSLAYHQSIAKVLRKLPDKAIVKAKRVLQKMRRDHPEVKPLWDRWRLWLDLPIEELISKILDAGMTAREMRQVTPFAGLLSPQDRFRILRKFREGYPQ